MNHAAFALLTLLLLGAPFTASGQDSASPHHGTEMCAVCHNEDMTLARSKLETCTLCHAQTVHAGAGEHLRIDPARVAQALSTQPEPKVKLPLTDDGHIWCGTCHLFHDPSMGDAWLTTGWIPPNTGLPEAVRNGVTQRWSGVAKAYDQPKVEAEFASKGTRALRLSVDDGRLCRQCHGSLP